MASKNSIKIYSPDTFYHIYNRGVEQRDIFLDDQDYSVFLSYLKTYLTPKDEVGLIKTLSDSKSNPDEKNLAKKLLKLKNYYGEIELHCYALLPNHFHLLIKHLNTTLDKFMNSLGTRYAMYFNRKYHRKGVLFQDVYKAVMVESDEQLLHLSRYIHLNPTEAMGLPVSRWRDAKFPTSLPEYLKERHTKWINTDFILNYFSKSNPNNTYESFIGAQIDLEPISGILLDID